MKQRLNLSVNRVLGRSASMVWATCRRPTWGVSLLWLVGLASVPGLVQAQSPQSSVDLAQAYGATPPPPDGAIPVPSTGAMPPSTTGSQNFSGQQYVVFVSGNSDMLLGQVRLVEPTAFRTSHQGQTVIQAGRFNSPQNANERLGQLAMQGIGATVAEVPVASPYYAQTPAQSSNVNVYATSGELPPIPTGTVPQVTQVQPQQVPALPPVTATPAAPSGSLSTPAAPAQGSLEFGQELAYSAPPNPGSYPVNTTPPGTAAAAPAGGARVSAPYYVVIPTVESNLPELSTQIIQLGTPADRVQQRLSPRGPHVSIGPFEDRDLAFQWNRFYREAGIANSRVHYDP